MKSALHNGDTRKNAVLSQNNLTPKVNPFELAQKVFRERDKDNKVVTDTIKPTVSRETIKPAVDPFSLLDEPIEVKEDKPVSFVSKVSDSSNPLDIYSNTVIYNSNATKDLDSNNQDVNTVETTASFTEQKVQSAPEISKAEGNKSLKKEEVSIGEQEQIQIDEIKPLIEQNTDTFRYIGEAFKTYIIIEKNEKELILIDKHAAHERIIYERLKAEKGSGYSQILLEPIAITLNKIDYNSVINNTDVFLEAGFEVEDFGNGMILVRSAPQYLENEDIEQTVIEMSGYLTENKTDIRTEQMDWIYHNVSCRAAIKAGNISTDRELIDIARRLENDDSLRYCPHGRPLCIVLSKYEIEKQFGRV